MDMLKVTILADRPLCSTGYTLDAADRLDFHRELDRVRRHARSVGYSAHVQIALISDEGETLLRFEGEV